MCQHLASAGRSRCEDRSWFEAIHDGDHRIGVRPGGVVIDRRVGSMMNRANPGACQVVDALLSVRTDDEGVDIRIQPARG